MIAGTRITKVIRKSERPGCEAWEQTYNGKTWEDMPTVGGYWHKLLDFALYRRGMYDPEFDLAVEAEDDEDEGVKTPRRTMNQRRFGAFGGRGRMALKAARAQERAEREITNREEYLFLKKQDEEARYARQGGLLVLWLRAKMSRGFVRAFYNADCTAHSALMRALGKGRANQGPLRAVSLDRIERNFERLKGEGWPL